MKKIYLVFLILLIHCVFPDRRINLKNYNHKSFDNKDTKKIFLEINDQRKPFSNAFFGKTDSERIGHVRNGYYMPMTNVLTREMVFEWVKRVFENNLTKNNYIIVKNNESYDYKIQITLFKFYVDNYFNCHGQVILGLLIFDSKENKIFSSEFEEEDRVFSIDASEYCFEEAFNNAAKASFQESLSKIKNIIK